MNIKAINAISNFMGKEPVNPVQKTPKLNFEIKDNVSFSGKKSPKKPESYGPIYKNLEELYKGKEKTIQELREAFKRGEDIEEGRGKLILSRIDIALCDAEKFTKEHPEFNIEDVGQDLILCVINATDSEIQSESEYGTFGAAYLKRKDAYFKKLLKEPKKESLYLEIKDDESLDEIIDQIMLKKDIDKLLETLSPNEERALSMRFGLHNDGPYIYEDIAKEADTSVQRQKELLTKALRKMRYPARARRIYPYYRENSKKEFDYSQIPSEILFQHIKNAYKFFPKTEFRDEYVKELKRALEISQKRENGTN